MATAYDEAPAGTTGGAGRAVHTVTTLADGGEGSLRSFLGDGGGDVRFSPGLSGELWLATPVKVPSDTTVSGIGADVTIVKRGLWVDGASNVILRGLSFRGVGAAPDLSVGNDAVTITSSSNVWVNHVDFDGTGAVDPDGLLDVGRGSTAVTISWNRFTAHDKVMLLGALTPKGLPALVDITVHHNLFVGTRQRHPMMRQGRFNIYNNVLDSWGTSTATNGGYGIKAACGAYARLEANIFKPSLNRLAAYLADEPECALERRPAIDLVANRANGAELAERNPSAVTVAAAQVQPADSDLEEDVRSGAGRRGAPGEVPPTTAPPTTTSSTTAPPTTAPPSDVHPVSLKQTKVDRLEVSWLAAPGASSYRWSISTCAGASVHTSDTMATVKTSPALPRGCYTASVWTLKPTRLLGTSRQVQLI